MQGQDSNELDTDLIAHIRKFMMSPVQLGKVYNEVIKEIKNSSVATTWLPTDIRYRYLITLYSSLNQAVSDVHRFRSSFAYTSNQPDPEVMDFLKGIIAKSFSSLSEKLFRLSIYLIDAYNPEAASTIRRSIGTDIPLSDLMSHLIGHQLEKNRSSYQRIARLLTDQYNGNGYWEPEPDVGYYFYLIKSALMEHLDETQPLLRQQVLASIDSWIESLETAQKKLAQFLHSNWFKEDAVNEKDHPFDPNRLMNNSISAELRTCLLSCSFIDREIALRIYRDLQNAGIDVFYAPNDALQSLFPFDEDVVNIGDLNYIILLLSKNSLESSWILAELRRTLLRKLEQRQPILIPVLLDDYFFMQPDSLDSPQLKSFKEQIKHMIIADFRDNEDYINQLPKLLIALMNSNG